MKKENIFKHSILIVPIIIFIIALITFTPVFAETGTTPTLSPSQNEVPTDASDLLKIEKIKDIVASKVAELNLVEKRGIMGTVKDHSATEVTITDIKGQIRNIDIDELTKFSDSNNKNFGISDLQKGQLYSFVGLYNKDTQRLLARDVTSIDTVPLYFAGAITDINNNNYVLTAVNAKGEKKKIDIQDSTKNSALTSSWDLQKAGFSKFTLGERVLVVGFLNKTDSNLIEASRIIQFGDIVPPSKEMQQYIPASQASASAKTTDKTSK